MAFVAGRSADAKKIEKKPAADAGNAPDAVAAKEAPKEPARKTPPAGKTPEARHPPPAPATNVAAAPSASAEGLAAIRKHLDATPPPAVTPSKEPTPAEPAPTSVRIDASASSNAPTIAADSVPPPKKDETRRSHITPEEKKAAIAASGPVIEPSSSPSPPKAAKKSEGDSGIKVVLKEPDAKKSTGDTLKPAAPKSEKTEEKPAAKKSGWATYAIWVLGGILGLLAMASILKYARQGDLNISADAPAATGQTKASQMPTTPATAEPAVTPPIPGIVFPREGLPVNAENLNRVFGQTDVTRYRQTSEWKKGDPYFCFCTPVDNKDETFNVSSCKICKK